MMPGPFQVDWSKEGALQARIEAVVGVIARRGGLQPRPFPQRGFQAWLSGVEQCRIDATSITPASAALLYALADASGARRLLGVGTYEGLPFSALTAGAVGRNPWGVLGAGVDIDETATSVARTNARTLGLAPFLRYRVAEGRSYAASLGLPVDLLYLDMDEPGRGKAGYADVVRALSRRFAPHAMVLAHDPLVPKFAGDFNALRTALAEDGGFGDPVIVEIDRPGLLICIRSRAVAARVET